MAFGDRPRHTLLGRAIFLGLPSWRLAGLAATPEWLLGPYPAIGSRSFFRSLPRADWSRSSLVALAFRNLLSLTFLGLDLALGASFPSGIHCLGHLLKGLMSEMSTMPVLASPRGWPALRSAAMMHLQPIWATGPLLAFRRSCYDQLLIHHHPARSGGLGPTALVGGTVDGADSFVSL